MPELRMTAHLLPATIGTVASMNHSYVWRRFAGRAAGSPPYRRQKHSVGIGRTRGMPVSNVLEGVARAVVALLGVEGGGARLDHFLNPSGAAALLELFGPTTRVKGQFRLTCSPSKRAPMRRSWPNGAVAKLARASYRACTAHFSERRRRFSALTHTSRWHLLYRLPTDWIEASLLRSPTDETHSDSPHWPMQRSAISSGQNR